MRASASLSIEITAIQRSRRRSADPSRLGRLAVGGPRPLIGYRPGSQILRLAGATRGRRRYSSRHRSRSASRLIVKDHDAGREAIAAGPETSAPLDCDSGAHQCSSSSEAQARSCWQWPSANKTPLSQRRESSSTTRACHPPTFDDAPNVSRVPVSRARQRVGRRTWFSNQRGRPRFPVPRLHGKPDAPVRPRGGTGEAPCRERRRGSD